MQSHLDASAEPQSEGKRTGIWWLSSYPKSGNTWLRAVVETLIAGRPVDINAMASTGRPPRLAASPAAPENETNPQAAISTEREARIYEDWAARAGRPVYCKTHDPYRLGAATLRHMAEAGVPAEHLARAREPLIPASVTLGAIYVVRDPRAVAVSLAHHLACPIDEAIGHLEQPPWRDHVESWLEAPFPVHLARYEDLHADPHAGFAAIAQVLGLPSRREDIALAVEATSFSKLQAQERQAGYVDKPPSAVVFFREGRVDGWRRRLTPAQSDRIVESNTAIMRRLGYDVTLAPNGTAEQ